MAADTSGLRAYVSQLSDGDLDEVIRLALRRRLADNAPSRPHVVVDKNNSVLFTVYPAGECVEAGEVVELDPETLAALGYHSKADFHQALARHG